MKTHFIVLLVMTVNLWLVAATCAQQVFQSNHDPVAYANLKNELESLGRQYKLPGFSAGILLGDSLIWEMAWGMASVEKNLPATPMTCYSLASLGKPFAAVSGLRLREWGLFDPDAPVVPSLMPVLIRYGIPIDESVGEITARHLMAHTSDDPPGIWYHYDGDRYALLTTVLEQASGYAYDQLIQETVLNPAGMKSTCPATKTNLYSDIAGRLASPYTYDSAGNLIPGSYTNQCNASTGWISTVGDLARFVSALNGNQLLPADATTELFTPYQMKTGARSISALGWFSERLGSVDLIWNQGFGYGTSGLILMIPQLEMTFIMLANSDRMSRSFGLGLPGISVLESPFAHTFFETVVVSAGEDPGIASRPGMPSRVPFDLPGEKTWASIREITAKSHYRQPFSLPSDTLIHLVAVADGGYAPRLGMYDEVYISDAVTHRILWRMEAIHTTPAGGHPRNRFVNLVCPLDSGSYILHFDNRQSPYSHFPGHWEAAPPPEESWGVAISILLPEPDALEAQIAANAARNLYEQNRWLFEKGHRKGYFFMLHPALPSLKPYKQFSWFDTVVSTDQRLRDEAIARAKTSYELQFPAGYDSSGAWPLILVFHGGGSSREQARQRWQSNVMSNKFIVAYLQSYRHYKTNTFGWLGGDSRAREEISECLQEIMDNHPIDTNRIILAGISAGASMAADLFVNGVIPATGLLGFSPLMPNLDTPTTPCKKWNQEKQAILIIGENDLEIRHQNLQKLSTHLHACHIPCTYISISGLGHTYPGDFSWYLDQWLEEMLNRYD